MNVGYIIIGLLFAGALFIGSPEKIKTESKPAKSQPRQQDVSNILAELESNLGLVGLHDVFMGFAKVESNFVITATRPEPNGYTRMQANIKSFYANPWRDDPSVWQKTMGLFQQFPGSALLTSDETAVNWNPEILYDMPYAIVLAVDFAYRLHKKYGASTWWDIRRGWASLKTLNSPNSSYAQEVLGRLLKGIEGTGGNTEFIYTVPNWSQYEKTGFKDTLNYILSLKGTLYN